MCGGMNHNRVVLSCGSRGAGSGWFACAAPHHGRLKTSRTPLSVVRVSDAVRYALFFGAVILVVGLAMTAVASAVLPVSGTLSRRTLVAIGVAAAVLGFVVAIAADASIGIIVAAAVPFVAVFVYDRFVRSRSVAV